MQTSKPSSLFYRQSLHPKPYFTPKARTVKVLKCGVSLLTGGSPSPSRLSSRLDRSSPAPDGQIGNTTIELERERQVQDLNYRLFQTLELRLQKSDVFNDMFAKFMESYKLYEVSEFNRKIDENTQSHCTSQLNAYQKLKLFPNSLKNRNVEFMCFKEMIKSKQVTIIDFIRHEFKQYKELRTTLRLGPADMAVFKRDYFVHMDELKTVLEIRGIVLNRLKAKRPIARIDEIIAESRLLNHHGFKNSLVRVQADNQLSCPSLQWTKRADGGVDKSRVAQLVSTINTEIHKKKEFTALRKYIKGIISCTEKLKTQPLDVTHAQSKNEAVNEKYHRANLMKRVVKTNLIFYLMLQIGNKQGFIVLADQLEFV